MTLSAYAPCTDGASVMTKVGKKLISAEQQLCYAHAIQPAVLDVLYRDHRSQPPSSVAQLPVVESVGDIDMAENYDSDDNDGDADGLGVIDDAPNLVFELSGDYKEVVDKVRKIVKLFRRSPTKNDDTLQPYVRPEFGKELVLLLDCRTGWSSLADMLNQFLMLHTSIQKALIDLGETTQLTDGDFGMIEEMVSSLEPVKIAVKAICRRDTNLIGAEPALHFCIIQLQKQWSELAKVLAEAIENRIKARRAMHAGVLQYLHSNSARESASEVFLLPSNAAVRKFVHSMVKRLDYNEESTCSDATAAAAVPVPLPERQSQSHESSAESFAQQLEVVMRQSVASTSASVPQTPKAVHDGDENLLASIKAEMAVYESTGKRGRCLQQVYEYLLACPPTSVEAERAFSAEAFFV